MSKLQKSLRCRYEQSRITLVLCLGYFKYLMVATSRASFLSWLRPISFFRICALSLTVIVLHSAGLCQQKTTSTSQKASTPKTIVAGITATLTVTQGDKQPPGTQVWLNLQAKSGSPITQIVWDCNSGAASVGAHPKAGPLAYPPTKALSGTFVNEISCFYKQVGTHKPFVRITDHTSHFLEVSTTVTVTPATTPVD